MAHHGLNEYGIIGNGRSAALIGRSGSVDWLCFPELDSPSHFGALLDESRGGTFEISPASEHRGRQRYLESSNVLQTVFETPGGRGQVTDWMLAEDDLSRPPALYRRVEVLDGKIDWVMRCAPKFEYGADEARVERHGNGILFRGNTPQDIARLQATVGITLTAERGVAVARFSLSPGERADFEWIWGRERGRRAFPDPESTNAYWRSRAHRCSEHGFSPTCLFAGPWHEAVVRSGLIVELLTSHFADSIAESPTTSVPDWDYRYAWIRNLAFTLESLDALGMRQQAFALFSWLTDIVIRDGAELLQSVYTLDGDRQVPERDLPFLSGYEGSHAVRVGNRAARQFQLDIYGHVLLAAVWFVEAGGTISRELWAKLVEIVDFAAQAWRRPDHGPWETRSRPEHYVASKVLCWAALDRGIRLATLRNQEFPSRWDEERGILHKTICLHGYDETIGAFVRSFGTTELDASAMMVPLTGFLPWDDERVQRTLDAIREQLSEGVLIRRSSAELPHVSASFWFAGCLARLGRTDEATDRLAEICTYASPVGLFGQSIRVGDGQATGNYPSSSSHLALLHAAVALGLALGRHPRAKLEPSRAA